MLFANGALYECCVHCLSPLCTTAHPPGENVTAAKAPVATAPERDVTAQSPQVS